MWGKLKTTYGIQLKRDTVMNILREEDPEGTLQRKSRSIIRRVYTCQGPNNVWHVDGNDKIKQYGFPIHTCIDGFSRKVIWLKVARSNNNPVIPASYFLKAVASLQVIPDPLQTDCGDENCFMAGIQCKLANNVDAHRYGSSTSNQRIENFWSHNRKLYLSWIINFFKDLVNTGNLILGNVFHIECLWFIFSALIQHDLDRVREEWNLHKIRKSNRTNIYEISDELYLYPESRGYVQCGKNITDAEVDDILHYRDVHTEAGNINKWFDQNLLDYFNYVLQEHHMSYPPRDWNEAKGMYESIIESAAQ